MKLTKQQLKEIIKEETLVEHVKHIYASHGYTLTESLIQEIDWSRAKRLLKKGITGLALVGALSGIATPAMAGEGAPDGASCSATQCSIEIQPADEAAMKKELARLVKGLIDAGETPEDAAEYAGWSAEWGDYNQYLEEGMLDSYTRKNKLKLTESQLKQIIREEFKKAIRELATFNPNYM